jgi:hypothetical protein
MLTKNGIPQINFFGGVTAFSTKSLGGWEITVLPFPGLESDPRGGARSDRDNDALGARTATARTSREVH